MDTELVFTGNGDIFCDSMKISEKLDVPHKDLLRTIEKILKKKQCADQHLVNSQKFIETQFTNKQGRTYKKYDLNEPAFIKLVMQLK
jgi:phage regulator Rha-like protein